VGPFLKVEYFSNLRIYLIGILICLAIAFFRNLEKSELELKLGAGGKIKILEGDVVKDASHALCFSISDTLETKSSIITNRSVTSQVVKHFFNGDEVSANSEFRVAFDEVEDGAVEVPAIGFLEAKNIKLFPIAAFQMNEDNMVETDVSILMKSFEMLWDHVRSNVNQEPVSIPIIGTGFGRLNVSDLAILQLMIVSYVAASRKRSVTEELRIYIPTRVKKLMYMNELESWYTFVIKEVENE